MKKAISFLLMFSLLFCLVATATASSGDEKKINDKKSELSGVNQDIESTKKELDQVKDAQVAVEEQLEDIEAEIDNKEKELSRVEKELDEVQANLEAIKQELNQAIEDAQLQQVAMGERLRSLYMNSTSSYLELILEARSINELLDRIEMIRQLAEYDQQVLEDMNAYAELVDGKRVECEEQEARIKDLREQVINQKIQIEEKHRERKKLLSRLEAQRDKYEKDLDTLEQASKELEKKIQQMLKELEEKKKQQSKYTGGVMTWPVPGFYRITSEFGNRRHPVYGTVRFHSGIDIGSNYSGSQKISINGRDFVAGAAGTVLFAGNYGGYGKCVIIDHGGGITTLYAHGSSILVSDGQSVKRGQPVLKVGSTGVSTGPHAHFEVRKNGAPVNPMSYIK